MDLSWFIMGEAQHGWDMVKGNPGLVGWCGKLIRWGWFQGGGVSTGGRQRNGELEFHNFSWRQGLLRQNWTVVTCHILTVKGTCVLIGLPISHYSFPWGLNSLPYADIVRGLHASPLIFNNPHFRAYAPFSQPTQKKKNKKGNNYTYEIELEPSVTIFNTNWIEIWHWTPSSNLDLII